MFLAIVNDVIVAGLGGRAHRPNKNCRAFSAHNFFLFQEPMKLQPFGGR